MLECSVWLSQPLSFKLKLLSSLGLERSDPILVHIHAEIQKILKPSSGTGYLT